VKANAWRKFLDEQRDAHGKILFTVTELANVAGASRAALNVELTRLREQEIIAKYAHGLYGLPGAVSPQALVAAIDSHAYITGHYALYAYSLVTQMPVAITCFTDRRSPRARDRISPVGRLIFASVRSGVYFPESAGAMASPAQAFCDYVYVSRRQGTAPETLVTFRHSARVRDADFPRIVARYPISVQEHVERLLNGADGL
jgi:hypothetical protein